MRFSLVVSVTFFFLGPAVSYGLDEVRDEKAAGEFFEKSIRPLLAKHCYECHSTDKAADNGHLALDGKGGLLAGGERGPIIVPGKADESLLVSAIRYGDPKLQMPPEGKLPDAEIELIARWISQGAFVPEYGEALIKKDKGINWATAKQFWSFQPLGSATVPAVTPQADILQPIDAFIQSGWASQQLSGSGPADKRTLARRAWFDLLGLPPRPEEITEFLDDPRPDAYERLVDRLLASPHFGERWARYWLDLARYTDVTPSWLKNADQAWLYRDWVIQAMNEDRPYDDFVKKQLAADTFEDSAPTDFAALGLLGLSPTYWKELMLAPSVIEVIVADEWDERIDAVTRTFLGLTVACARCHDHKFDPITTRDYYALAGVFASTQLTDRPLLPSPLAEQIVAARQRVDALEQTLKPMKDKESEEAKKLLAEIEEVRMQTPQFDARMAHVVEDASIFVMPNGPDATKLDVRKREPRDLPVFRRGNPSNPGEVVPRRFIEVLSPETPRQFVRGSGRREFSEALFTESKGLSARVMANRIWSYHFGRGLVKTPSDFGIQGDRPTHPELLEWLAAELAGGARPTGTQPWTMKRLHRMLATSTTFRQASDLAQGSTSTSVAASRQLDPENQWLSRMSRRRLDVEPWRDQMLSVADNLDETMGGPALELDLGTNFRRTVYGKVGRDEQNDLLRLYDFPPPTSHSPARDITTTPLQQLFVLNSDFVERQSLALVARVEAERPGASTPDKIQRCYELLFQRAAASEEVHVGEAFLKSAEGQASPGVSRWPLYVQSLLGLNEAMFVD